MPATVRRLLRILLNAARRVSLALCLVLVAAWVASHFVAVGFWHTPHGGRWRVDAASQRGVLLLEVGGYFDYPDPSWDRGGWWHAFSPGPLDTRAGWLGVRVVTERVVLSPHRRGGGRLRKMGWFETRRVTVAYGPLVLLTGLLPLAQLIRRKRAAPPRGLCPACGYDLRATPDRCPECGRAAAA
jgi:hypothetical protein